MPIMKRNLLCLFFIVPLTFTLYQCNTKNTTKPAGETVQKTSDKAQSNVKDSLDRIARKLTKSDFCTLQTTDVLNYAAAVHRTEKKYSSANMDENAVNKRMESELLIYQQISDSTIKANNWPDTIMKWVSHNSALLDTPCNKISRYIRMEIDGRNRLKGIY